MTTFEAKTAKQLGKDRASLLKLGTAFSTALHSHMFDCLVFASVHGQVGPCELLFKEIGGNHRTESMKSWFIALSGNQIVVRKDKPWGLKKGWKADAFKLDEARVTTMEMLLGKEPSTPKPLTLAQIVSILNGLKPRIEKAVKDNRFEGDVTLAKTFCDNVVKFATKEQAKLTLNGDNVPEQPKPRLIKRKVQVHKGEVTLGDIIPLVATKEPVENVA